METDFLDKILIGLLVLLLPVSIVVASQFQARTQERREQELKAEQLAKVEEAIQQLNATKKETAQAEEITIESVSYASESGELTITGKAPIRNFNVMVSAVVTPPAKQTAAEGSASGALMDKDDDETSVLGQAVDVVAVKTDETGAFTFIKKVNRKQADLVDLRFDQKQANATIQYNLVKNKRTL